MIAGPAGQRWWAGRPFQSLVRFVPGSLLFCCLKDFRVAVHLLAPSGPRAVERLMRPRHSCPQMMPAKYRKISSAPRAQIIPMIPVMPFTATLFLFWSTPQNGQATAPTGMALIVRPRTFYISGVLECPNSSGRLQSLLWLWYL